MQPPEAKRWDKSRYLNVRNHPLQLYKAPRNYLRTAATQVDRVAPVSVPPTNGRPGKIPVFLKNSNFSNFELLEFI